MTRFTIDIPDDIHLKLKHKAVVDRTTMKAIVVKYIQRGLGVKGQSDNIPTNIKK